MKLHTAHKRKHIRTRKAYRRLKFQLHSAALLLANKYKGGVAGIHNNVGDCFLRNTAIVRIKTDYKTQHGTFWCRFEVPREIIEGDAFPNNLYLRWQDMYLQRVPHMLAEYMVKTKMEIPQLKKIVKQHYREMAKRNRR